MKINKSILIFLLIGGVLGFILGWYLKAPGEREMWIPDKINLYYNEKQNQVSKIEWPEVYERILKSIVFEKGEMMSGGNPALTEEEIIEMKKSAIEYIYEKPLPIQIVHDQDNIEKVNFKSILFPIEEKWNGAAYIQTTDSRYLFLITRTNLFLILKHTQFGH